MTFSLKPQIKVTETAVRNECRSISGRSMARRAKPFAGNTVAFPIPYGIYRGGGKLL